LVPCHDTGSPRKLFPSITGRYCWYFATISCLAVKGSTTARQQLRVLNQWLARNPLPQPAALQAGLTLLQQTDLRAELAQIHCPALLCLGGHDALVPVGLAMLVNSGGLHYEKSSLNQPLIFLFYRIRDFFTYFTRFFT
jgi:pimeloyl-ACP methyl ester carboxylesterase